MMNNYEGAYADTILAHRILNFQKKSKNLGKITKILEPKNIYFLV
ncbi:hypothetical protein [Sphingobacterium sp. ML3W]|nr:hypothetical protein [Sphingobacterium sp. ML3W]